MSLPRIAVVALLVPLLAGCSWLFGIGGNTDAEVPLKRGTLLILPYSMPARSYFESTFGERFAKDVQTAVARACPSARILGPEDLPEGLKEEGVRTIKVGEVIDPEALYHIGRRLKADYVLVGEIHTIQSKKPKSFGVLQGRMVLSARVADVKELKIAWRTDHATFTYPKKVFDEEMPAAIEDDENIVLRKVMVEAARGLTEPFAGRERTLEEDVTNVLH
jgi:hypothetical protein